MLSENIIRQVARRTGLASICITRLLGSQRVKFGGDASGRDGGADESASSRSAIEGKMYQLGFNIDSGELMKVRDTLALTTMLCQAINEYKRVCPLVVIWIGRGDFNPNKLPENIGGGHLLHANRTVGRLKARLLRDTNLKR